MVQVLSALQLLHAKGICHRDLKAANTFLGEDGRVKIGDMNVSQQLKYGPLNTQIGTPYYMSPEIWSSRPYDEKCDVWSVGCMIYELASLRPPFLGDSFPALKRSVLTGRYPSLPKVYSEALSRVVSAMLRLAPRERPTAAELLALPELQAFALAAGIHSDCAQQCHSSEPAAMGQLPLPPHPPQHVLQTIKVPQVLAKLNDMLPRPCYPSAGGLPEAKPALHIPVEAVAGPAAQMHPPIAIPTVLADGNSAQHQDKENVEVANARQEVVLMHEPTKPPVPPLRPPQRLYYHQHRYR
jgi:serine/threonine protein kinase